MTAAIVVPSVQRPWRRAAAWLAFLGPFFFASYGLATWLAGLRPHVDAVAFDWERAIPFVPWTIVPYWSIDLLYAASLFVCRDRDELDTHAMRLLTAQVVAVTCFVLFPLRFSYDRPDAEGAFGALFGLLAAFDRPFNQAPSLHVALLVILWALYARRIDGIARIALHAWFALIGVSVLTTWQHHFIDLPTGALLGYFCLWLWPQRGVTPWAAARGASGWSGDPRRRRLALRYLAGALAAAFAAAALGGAALWLSWVGVALGLVALNYALIGVEGFQKRDGRLSPGASALLLPYLAGAFVNSRAWTRRHPAPDPIGDGVWLGRLPTRSELERSGFDAIVDLAAELPIDPGPRAYSNVPILDLTLPDAATLARAASAIERARSHGRVLVCCALGYTRSALAVAAWLVATGRAADASAAIARVAAARPGIVLDGAHRALITAMAPHNARASPGDASSSAPSRAHA